MADTDGLIQHLKTQQPKTWALLEDAAREGLVAIDEQIDAVTATNRLLLTYPGLHNAIATLTNAWAERSFDASAHVAQLLKPHTSEENPDD